jgi:mannitol/fructose-specific phosphotransferase system IIA component (Ntr-type)
MSKKFIDQYILLQKIWIIFSEEKDSVIELINHFSPDEELNELIWSIKTIPIDLKQDTVLIHNFFDLISDDEFIAKLNATHKKKISQSLFELLLESTEDIKIYELLRYWLSVIFRKYGEFIEDSQALKLYSQQILLETSPHLFLNYFRKPWSESEYFHSLLFELEKTDEWSVTRYSVHKEDITFILSNQDLLNDFIQYITDSRNIEKTIDLLRQRWKSYSWENEDWIEFIKLINDLSDEQTKHFERFIFSFISKYFEVRYSQEYRYWNIEDILRSDLFHSLLIKIASSNSDFFTKIMNLFDDTDKFIQW